MKRTKPLITVLPPGPNSRRAIEQDALLLSTSLSRQYGLVASRAYGAFVEDVDNNIFLDFGSGISVTVMGHTHPHVVNAIKKQSEVLIYANSCDYFTLPQIDYARRILFLSPGQFLKRIFYSNSGSESVECAIKSAKYHTKRSGIIAFVGGFHGRTMGALALTSNSPVSRRKYTDSLMPNVAFAPYAYCYRCPFGMVEKTCDLECIKYLKNWVLGKVMPVEDCAAIIVEPIQGAGGYIVPPDRFLIGIEQVCHENDILFVVDEVQTSFGKTGHMFASEYFGITPDILCASKAIAAGLPMGITIARSNLLDWDYNTHENTLGGSPLVVAAALAVLDIFEEENLIKAAVRIGKHLTVGLKEMQKKFEVIGDVRSAGSMIGIEFVKDRSSKIPASNIRDSFTKGCFERGLLTLSAGESSVRLSPPFILSEKQVDIGLSIMLDTLEAIV